MNRLENVSSFIVMDIMKAALAYDDAIHFEVGQPDLMPAPGVREAMIRAVNEGRTAYTEAAGLFELREKISRFYAERYGVDVDPKRIMLTPGTSGAFFVAYSILANAGQKIAMADPGYPCYRNFCHLLDVCPLPIPVDASTNYCLTPAHLEAAGEAAAVQISSPANPTGTVYRPEQLEALIAYAKRTGISFISDEIYHGLTFDADEHTALEYDDDAIVINGFSKYFSMPGIRLGWMIVPERLVRSVEKVLQNAFICPSSISQYGALGAFDQSHLDGLTETFRQRRDFLYGELKDLFTFETRPEGAFYLWADMGRYGDDSFEFAKRLLEATHVAVTPGIDFGVNDTNRFIRFAYTRSIDHMAEGVARIRKYLNG